MVSFLRSYKKIAHKSVRDLHLDYQKKIGDLTDHAREKGVKVENLKRHVATHRARAETLKVYVAAHRLKVEAMKGYVAKNREKVEVMRRYLVAMSDKVEVLRQYIKADRAKLAVMKQRSIEFRQKFDQLRNFYRAARPFFPLYFQGLLAEAATRSAENLKSDCYIALLPSSLPTAFELRRLNGGGSVFCDNVENVDVHMHSAAPKWSPITLGMVNYAAYGAMLQTDGLITIGDALAKTLDRFSRPVHVLKNFREFSVSTPNDELRTMCGVSADDTLLFASGNVVIGFEPVLRALVDLPESYHLAAFVRLVPVSYRESIESLVIELGLQHRVHFFAFVDYGRLAHLAAGADIGLITSDIANPNGAVGLPNRCFDYIAAGLPVIAPAMPDVKALVSEYGFGEILESTTAEAWAASIQQVAARKTHYRMQSQLARESLTWESQEDALYEFLGEPKSVTLIAFRDLTKYQRYKRLSRTLLKRGCKVRAAFVSMDPDLENLVDGVEYYVTNERHQVVNGLVKLND
ncbi:Glycosyltransferase [Pseudomonas reidholzensis]|uniref:Glycosyltransferase n=2 Tax=Pseudomonas reidholzensis TaxID=1785162 RepID=A0A383RQW6_9PSED|nr:Glycosyltransferase [Pseudomonas reidholzensis]